MRAAVEVVGVLAAGGFLLSVGGGSRILAPFVAGLLAIFDRRYREVVRRQGGGPVYGGVDWRGRPTTMAVGPIGRLCDWLFHPWHPNRVLLPGIPALLAVSWLGWRVLDAAGFFGLGR